LNCQLRRGLPAKTRQLASVIACGLFVTSFKISAAPDFSFRRTLYGGDTLSVAKNRRYRLNRDVAGRHSTDFVSGGRKHEFGQGLN
jgi:hypothetical protein